MKNDHPYVVVLDGHYTILERKRSIHRWMVTLHRHSAENYLAEKGPFESICRNYAAKGDSESFKSQDFQTLLESLEHELIELLVLDIAHTRARTGEKVLPDGVESLLEDQKGEIVFSTQRINGKRASAINNIASDEIELARALLENYLCMHRFIDILKGHFVFSLIRILFLNTVINETGRKPNIDNDGLRILLAKEVWEQLPSKDHTSLKRRLRKAVQEATLTRKAQ